MTNEEINALVDELMAGTRSVNTTEEIQNIIPTEELRQTFEEDNTESRTPVVPENPITATINETTARFSSAVWYEQMRNQDIILAGVGGIGSYVGFLLGRLKPRIITIFDPDMVEETNLSGQLYSRENIGEMKSQALRRFINSYCDFYYVQSMDIFYNENSLRNKIMICGFDNMEARRIFYNNWRNYVMCLPVEERKSCLFIDGRLAAEEFQVFAITGDDTYHMNQYETNYLFSDEEADATVCSYKQTSFMATMIASVMINVLVNFITNQCEGILIERDLPFITRYSGETMYFKTIV